MLITLPKEIFDTSIFNNLGFILQTVCKNLNINYLSQIIYGNVMNFLLTFLVEFDDDRVIIARNQYLI